jgi:3-hydroxyisobutyrate dehydrogenase-like beta-hydroxyacid dehydrogenase
MIVALIGAGTMGRILAASLAAAGHTVLAVDPDPEAQAGARAAGAAVLDSPAEAAARAGVVLLSLPGPTQVRDVVAALLAAEPRDLVIVDTSTVDPGTTREMAARAAERGVGYLDAPILGRPASAGRWTLPVGGDPAVLDRVSPMLQAFAARVVWVGPSGSGHTLKLLNQMMFTTINAVTAEVLATAAKLGLAPRTFVDVVASSGAATVSGLFREVAAKIVARDFAPTFSVGLLCKDAGLALETARAGGAPALLTGLAQTLTQLALARGYGSQDTAAVVRVYEDLLGLDDEAGGDAEAAR